MNPAGELLEVLVVDELKTEPVANAVFEERLERRLAIDRQIDADDVAGALGKQRRAGPQAVDLLLQLRRMAARLGHVARVVTLGYRPPLPFPLRACRRRSRPRRSGNSPRSNPHPRSLPRSHPSRHRRPLLMRRSRPGGARGARGVRRGRAAGRFLHRGLSEGPGSVEELGRTKTNRGLNPFSGSRRRRCRSRCGRRRGGLQSPARSA